jgi:hypothetical protein
MDNPASESSNSPLDTNQAAAAFASILSTDPPKDAPQRSEPTGESPEAAAERLAAEELAGKQEQSEPGSETRPEQPQMFTVKIDGKDVEVPLDELRNGYQRQQDYTRKTMEAAEQRKAAEAEATAARQERQQYAQNLQALSQQLGAVLQDQQQNIDWQQLLDTNPTEYLRQKHLFEQRQATFQKVQAEQARLWEQQQAEQAKNVQSYLAAQQQELLAKLPEWKDETKAKAEKAAIAEFLGKNGFKPEELGNVADHRFVILARNAMKYAQLMEKAQAATKRVEKLPPKVERPGVVETTKPDGRTAAMQRLGKTGRVEDAAAVFAQFL